MWYNEIMENVVIETKDEASLAHIIKLISQSFCTLEKPFYSESEFKFAYKALTSFDIFNKNSLKKLVDTGDVKVFMCISNGRIGGVSLLEAKTGRIYCLCATNNVTFIDVARDLMDGMIEARADHTKPWFDIMAFIGQEKILKNLGFRKIFDTVINYRGIKFVPMRYDYTQLDIEK